MQQKLQKDGIETNVAKALGLLSHILRRWLDPPNPPQPSSQEVVGALGKTRTDKRFDVLTECRRNALGGIGEGFKSSCSFGNGYPCSVWGNGGQQVSAPHVDG